MAIRTKRVNQDIRTVTNEFMCFRRSGLVFSSHHKKMIDRYPEQWVAVYDGKVKAHSHNYDTALSRIDEMGIPRKLTLIRYISKKPSSMIL